VNHKEKAERRKLINDTIGQLLMLISQKAVEALQQQIQPPLGNVGSNPNRSARCEWSNA
jgi:hypothetical protein